MALEEREPLTSKVAELEANIIGLRTVAERLEAQAMEPSLIAASEGGSGRFGGTPTQEQRVAYAERQALLFAMRATLDELRRVEATRNAMLATSVERARR